VVSLFLVINSQKKNYFVLFIDDTSGYLEKHYIF